MTEDPDDAPERDDLRLARGIHIGTWLGVGLWLALGVVLWGCAPDGGMTPRAQRVFDVVCGYDARLQPIIVPVTVAVTAATPVGPAVAVGAGLDTMLAHPAIQAACVAYGTRPVAVVPEPIPATVPAPRPPV